MTWLWPAGLLALLALPVLVLLRLAGARRRAYRVGALLLWEQAAAGLPRGTGRALPPLPLLLLELGAVAALALGVAHPAWVAEAPALDVLVVMDRTASMAATGAGGTTAWQRGLQRLQARMAEWPRTTNYAVRTVPPLRSGALEGPREAVLAVLRTAQPDPNGAGDAAGAAGGDFHRTILVTDHLPALAEGDALEVIAVGEARDNVAITRAQVEGGRVFVVVANYAEADRTLAVQLLKDGREVARATAQVAPGRRSGVVLEATDGPLEGAVQVQLVHGDDALGSDDSIAFDRAPAQPLTVAWIGPESPALQRAIAAATGRRVRLAEADGDAPDVTVCHQTVPQPLPAGAVLIVDPDGPVPALGWEARAIPRAQLRPAGPHAQTWTRTELLQRLPPARGCAPTPPSGAVVHVETASPRPGAVVWSGTVKQQPVAVAGVPAEGGWELSPGYPIFWARILETLFATGAGPAVMERDAAESDLRGAVTAHRTGPPGRDDAAVMAATAASGRPWLVLVALVLLAWRLRRRP